MVSDTALSQGQQGSSDLPASPGPSKASPEEGAMRFLCSICCKGYAQRQGAWRHIRTVHYPNLCSLCKFKWCRPYEYKDHFKKKHPGVNPDVIPRRAPGSRYNDATIHTERIREQPPVSPPAVEHEQQKCAGSQPYPSAPPSPSGTRDTGVSPPAVSFVDQPVYAEKTVTMDEHEYAHGSEVLDATHLAMRLSNKELAGLMNDLDIFLWDGQFGLPSAHLSGSTATHSSSNPEMARIPTLSPPVGENYGALISNDPMVGLSLTLPPGGKPYATGG